MLRARRFDKTYIYGKERYLLLRKHLILLSRRMTISICDKKKRICAHHKASDKRIQYSIEHGRISSANHLLFIAIVINFYLFKCRRKCTLTFYYFNLLCYVHSMCTSRLADIVRAQYEGCAVQVGNERQIEKYRQFSHCLHAQSIVYFSQSPNESKPCLLAQHCALGSNTWVCSICSHGAKKTEHADLTICV